MIFKTNWERAFATVVFVISLAFIGWVLVYLVWDVVVDLRIVAAIALALLLYIIRDWLMLAWHGQAIVPRYDNTPMESRSIERYSGGQRLASIFMSNVKTALDWPEDDDETFIVRLPDEMRADGTAIARFIGSDRLATTIWHMHLVNDTSRRRWVRPGRLTRIEWEGVIRFMDREGFLEKFDGRGGGKLLPQGDDFWDVIVEAVKRSRWQQ